jgi:hypothetical protein
MFLFFIGLLCVPDWSEAAVKRATTCWRRSRADHNSDVGEEAGEDAEDKVRKQVCIIHASIVLYGEMELTKSKQEQYSNKRMQNMTDMTAIYILVRHDMTDMT